MSSEETRARLAQVITALEAGRLAPGAARPAAHRGRRRAGAGARGDRHRRVGEVVAHRRARAALPPRPGGQAPHRGAGRRPHPTARRRRPPRRPHPGQRRRGSAGAVPLAGHPRRGRGARGHRRHHPRLQGGRVRPGRRGDAWHRAGRRRHRRPRGPPRLRDDPGVRRRQPAREDRHARHGRGRGHQQVRAPRCRGRAAATSAVSWLATGSCSAPTRSSCRCSGRSPPASTTTASPRCTTTCGTDSSTTA